MIENINNNRMFHAYFIETNPQNSKKEKHGFFFVCNSKESAHKEFCEYARLSLGRDLNSEDVFIEEILEGTTIEKSEGKVTISCS